MRNKFLGTGQPGFHPFRKLKVFISGFRYAFLYDFSVAYKLVLSIVILAVCLFFHKWVDFLTIFAVTIIMLIAEMFNTTTEALCDFIETHKNEKIRVIKDIAAAATGLSILLWLVVLITEIVQLF
jgi:diacylglycerol kinase (ATP)